MVNLNLARKKIAFSDNISVLGVDIGGATTDVFSVFDEEFNREIDLGSPGQIPRHFQ